MSGIQQSDAGRDRRTDGRKMMDLETTRAGGAMLLAQSYFTTKVTRMRTT